MSDTSKGKAGILYLVPAPLDFGCESQTALTEVLPEGTLRRAASLTHWISENAKTARAYLKRIDALFPLAAPLQAQNIAELPREAHKKATMATRAAPFDPKPLLAPALAGQDMGLISEAGMPAVADPGSSIVRAAHDLGIRVVPLTGPVSLLLGLAASGLNGQNFAFVGYVPQDGAERTARIKEPGEPGPATRPNPAVHRDALPQCCPLAGAVANLAAQYQTGPGQRIDAGDGAHRKPSGARMAPAQYTSRQPHTGGVCHRPLST